LSFVEPTKKSKTFTRLFLEDKENHVSAAGVEIKTHWQLDEANSSDNGRLEGE